MAVPFAAAAPDGAVRIDFAVEDEDVAVRTARGADKRQRQRVEGVVFVAFAPVVRPVAQGIAFAQVVRQPRLFVAELAADGGEVGAEGCQ